MFFTKATYAELRQGYTNRNGFIFTALTDPTNVHDAIVVHAPQSAGCITPQLPHSSRSFAENRHFGRDRLAVSMPVASVLVGHSIRLCGRRIRFFAVVSYAMR